MFSFVKAVSVICINYTGLMFTVELIILATELCKLMQNNVYYRRSQMLQMDFRIPYSNKIQNVSAYFVTTYEQAVFAIDQGISRFGWAKLMQIGLDELYV